METKEICTEGEAVTVCWTVTGFGVDGVCTEGVKTVDMEEKEVVKDNCLKDDESPKEILADSCSTAATEVERDGLMEEEEELDVSRCGTGLLTTCEILVDTSGGLLVDD